METLTNDREIAEVIVLELVSESKFNRMINISLIQYSKGTKNYLSVRTNVIRAQAYHHRKSEHTYRLKELSDNIKHLVTVGIIKHYWEQHHESKFESWDIPPEARYLFGETRGIKEPETKTMEGPKSNVQNISVTEIELRVLAKYTDFANIVKKTAKGKYNTSNLSRIDKAFKAFAEGRHAWNTLRKSFAITIIGAKRYPSADEVVLMNLYALKLLQLHYKTLYNRDFTRWDIPPQCRYLFEPSTFEVKSIHDDLLDASSFVIQKIDTTDIYKQVADRIKQTQNQIFKPKLKTEEIIMTKIETVVRINNVDASNYTNDDIFSLIAKTEKDIEKLEAIKEKPTKLTAKIKAMQDSIKELVKIVDTRD